MMCIRHHHSALSLVAFICLLINGPGVFAQSSVITCSSEDQGVPVPLDSILVMNLTQGGDTMLYAPDTVLMLSLSTGIHGLLGDNSAVALNPNRPNPFIGSTEFEVSVRDGGEVTITVHDAMGRLIASRNDRLAPGQHSIRYQGGPQGALILSVSLNGERQVRHMQSMAAGDIPARLLHIGAKSGSGSPKGGGNFVWSPGDELRIIGYAETTAGPVGSGYDQLIPGPVENEVFDLLPGLVCVSAPTVSDGDGNVYRAVQIGGQCWTAENLRAARYANSDSIYNVQPIAAWQAETEGAWCHYDNDIANDAIYGKLYNGHAATDPRNACPNGWHVPTELDWQTLELALGMDPSELLLNNFRGQIPNVGGQMKSTSSLWSMPNTGAVNSSGLSLLPAGTRTGFTGTFDSKLFIAYMWTSTYYIPGAPFIRYLYYDNPGVYRISGDDYNGFCIRCVMD